LLDNTLKEVLDDKCKKRTHSDTDDVLVRTPLSF
jgi:hypothetical protein